MVTMERIGNRIYIIETVLFQGETFKNHCIRVSYNSNEQEWRVYLPDQTIIAADSLKTIYKARKSIIEQYDSAETWCINHNEPWY